MGRFDWGPEGPPEEAYSRVTEPERFLPLADWTLEFLSRLESEYDVSRDEGYCLDPDLAVTNPSRPTVRLTPRQDNSAPVAVAFNDPPGIYVRFGRFRIEPFPDCACDGCDEEAEDQFERFKQTMEALVAGRFREWFLLLPNGAGRFGHESWSDSHRRTGGSRVKPGSVSHYSDGGDRVWEWEPWPRKPTTPRGANAP